jgi:hypothetical protein
VTRLGESLPIERLIIREIAQFFGYFYLAKKLCINFDKKMVWATFWAIFSQTHPVPLVDILGRKRVFFCRENR